MILITGSSGLIGKTVVDRYPGSTRGLDLADGMDLMDVHDRRAALDGVSGVIHLAALSRVIDAEADPLRCVRVNVEGTAGLLHDMEAMANPPWIIYGSSREVYGEPTQIPTHEDHSLDPINIYGTSKVAAENLVRQYCRRTGAGGLILRFSNVYGNLNDHATRVIPAFVRAALCGETLRIDGPDHLFDFTHVNDTANAIIAGISDLQGGRSGCRAYNVLPGKGTTLQQLADLVCEICDSSSGKRVNTPRSYDVARFTGDPTRLNSELGVYCNTPLDIGITELARMMRGHLKRQVKN